MTSTLDRAAPRARAAQPGPRGRTWLYLVPLVLALGVFVLTNPHLYPNPVLHTTHLFQNRIDEMRNQQRVYADEVVTGTRAKVSYVFNGSFVDRSLSRGLPFPIEAVLAGVGAVALLVRSVIRWRREHRPPVEGLIFLTVLVYFVAVTAGLVMAWPRHVIPTIVLGALLGGLGASELVHQVGWLFRALTRRAPATGGTRV